MLAPDMIKSSLGQTLVVLAVCTLPGGVSCSTVEGEGTGPDQNGATSADSDTDDSSPSTDDTEADSDDSSLDTDDTDSPSTSTEDATSDSEDTDELGGGATCRNGSVEADEECDDSNADPDDGCADCQVTDGYVCEGEPSTCSDVNECDGEENPCGEGATCENLPGSFECACKQGYKDDDGECVDIDECRQGLASCFERSTCQNKVGSYACVCSDGFVEIPGGCGCEQPSAENHHMVDPGFDEGDVIKSDNGLGGVWDTEGGAAWSSDEDVNDCPESGSLKLVADTQGGQSTKYCAFVYSDTQLWFGFHSLGTSGATFSYELGVYRSSNCGETPTRVLSRASIGPVSSSEDEWTEEGSAAYPLNAEEHSVSITITLEPATSGTETLYLDRFYLSSVNHF